MIVVEGPDGAGKTTLIEHLSRFLDIRVAPRVVSKEAEAMVDLKRWVENNVRLGWQETIFDRHRLISEPIYGAAMRTKFEPGFNDPQWFYEALFRFYRAEPLVIYCLPPYEIVWENIMGDNDNAVFHQQGGLVKQIWSAYLNKAMTDQVLRTRNTWVYDYTRHDRLFLMSMTKVIARAVEERRRCNELQR